MAAKIASGISAVWSHPLARVGVGVLWLGCLAATLFSLVGAMWAWSSSGFNPAALVAPLGISWLTGWVMVAAATLLMAKRSREPVSVLFSLTFLALANIGMRDAWIQVEWYESDQVFDTAWLVLLLLAIPALPSGHYRPRWLIWSLLVAPIAGLSIAPIPGLPGFYLYPEQFDAARFALLLVAIGTVFLRFRYTPRGLERQQLKWASLGLSAGMILYAASFGIRMAQASPLGSTPFMLEGYDALAYAQAVLTTVAFLLMALGVLVCLMDYRLNDADAAIARSAGYATVAGGMALFWAVAAVWIDEGMKALVGGENEGLATTISTVLVLLMLNPAQTRIMSWTERTFLRALVRLQELPARLVRWQHEDDPRRVAEATLSAVVDGVNAQYGAVVAYDGAGLPWVIAAHDVDAEVALMGLDGPDSIAFPQRVSLDDGPDHVGWLLIGPRTDGARYSADERAAINMVVDPLSDAIRHSLRRNQRHSVLLRSLEDVEARLARMEAMGNGSSQKSAAG